MCRPFADDVETAGGGEAAEGDGDGAAVDEGAQLRAAR